MEKFRKKVEKRLHVDITVCLCSLALYFALLFVTKGASDFAQNISMGVFIGMELVTVYNLAAAYTALHNEKN